MGYIRAPSPARSTPSCPARCSTRSTPSRRRCRPSARRSCARSRPSSAPAGPAPASTTCCPRRSPPAARPAGAPRTCATSTCRWSAASRCTAATSPRWSPARARRCRHPARLPQRPRAEGRPHHHGQRLPRPPRLRVDAAHLPRPGRHGQLHPVRHGPRRPPPGLRLRHHLRHQLRVRLRLPARQHEARPPRRRQLRPVLPAGAAPAAELRHHRRGGQHPHRRGPHPAHHLRPGLHRHPPLRQGQRHRRAAHRPAEGRARPLLRGQGEGAHRPPDRRGRPQGRGARRRRELLHRRQHGVAAPHRQRHEGAPPVQARQALRRHPRRGGGRPGHRHHRRVHRPAHAGPAVVRRPAPGGRGQARPRRRQDQGRDADAGHGHAAKLLPHVQEARRHDRHRHDRGGRVLEDLQARRHRHPDQQAAHPHRPRRRHLPHREGEVAGGRR